MPRIHETRIFVASPGDLAPERDALDAVAEDLTHAFGGDRRFRVLRWERDAYPGMGRPQGVVNDRIGDDYDVFVGLMWKKLGTPTGAAPSGTVEEFDRAYARWEQTGRPPILFYFCERPFFPGTAEEIDQFSKVAAFRQRVQGHGITGQFVTTEEFATQARHDLSRAIRALDAEDAQRTPEQTPPPATGATDRAASRQPSAPESPVPIETPATRTFPNLHVPSIPQQPTDRDRREFVRDGFAAIRAYFQQAAAALESQAPQVQVDVEDDTARSFICEVFVGGASKSRCRIWIGGGFGGDDQISFSFGGGIGSFSGNSMNDYVTIDQERDGALCFQASGMSHSQAVGQPLTPGAAAEHFWKRATEPLTYL